MDQIEEIKSKVDMVQLVGEYVQLKKAGRNYKGLCPLHGEKTPSFMVNPELQVFKCFGCGEGGDCFTWLQKIEGMEFGEALKTLADRVGVKLASYKMTGTEEIRERLLKANSWAAQYYHYLLTKHSLGKVALEYILKRGLTEETIEKFNLGYAPDGWVYGLKFLSKKGFSIDEMYKVGLVVEGKTYDRFRNRVMFPLNNVRGQVVGFAGRVLPAASAEAVASQGGKYVNTPETELYHKSELLYGLDVTKNDIRTAGLAVIVEGEIDMIASWQSGVKNVVAIKGSALTEKQVELLRRYGDTIVLALDADAAGDAASRRGIEIAQRAGLFVKVTNPKSQTPMNDSMTKFKDPGEIAIQNPELWRELVETAIPIYDFYIESAVERHGESTQGKMKIGRELVPIIARIEDEILKAEYVQKLARVLGVREEDVRAQLSKVPQASNPKSQIPNNYSSSNDSNTKKTRREVVEEYVVGMAIATGKFEQLADDTLDKLVQTAFWRKVVDELKKSPEVKLLPAEIRERVQIVVMGQQEWDDPAELDREWNRALVELEELEIREKMRADSNMEDLAVLTRRLGELTKHRL